MSYLTITALSTACGFGLDPHWIEDDKCLIYVDNADGTINKYYYESKRTKIQEIDVLPKYAGPAVVIPVEGEKDKFIFGSGHDLSAFRWNQCDPDFVQMRSTKLAQFYRNQDRNFVSHAKCDPRGRLWAGFGKQSERMFESGPDIAMFKVTENLVQQKIFDIASHVNGLTWSPDNKMFFFLDSRRLMVQNFDLAEGKISNKRMCMEFTEETIGDARPEGMTVDRNGNLWITLFRGGKVLCVDVTASKIIRKVAIPSLTTSSCCFGGPDYSTLFLTSTNIGLADNELRMFPDSGKIFEIIGLGVKGYPHNNFSINKSLLSGV